MRREQFRWVGILAVGHAEREVVVCEIAVGVEFDRAPEGSGRFVEIALLHVGHTERAVRQRRVRGDLDRAQGNAFGLFQLAHRDQHDTENPQAFRTIRAEFEHPAAISFGFLVMTTCFKNAGGHLQQFDVVREKFASPRAIFHRLVIAAEVMQRDGHQLPAKAVRRVSVDELLGGGDAFVDASTVVQVDKRGDFAGGQADGHPPTRRGIFDGAAVAGSPLIDCFGWSTAGSVPESLSGLGTMKVVCVDIIVMTPISLSIFGPLKPRCWPISSAIHAAFSSPAWRSASM